MRKLLLIAALFLAFTAAAPPQAMAAGTLAGTAISNQAYGDYKDANGNAMSRIYSNTVTVTVSQVAGVSINPASITSTAKNGDAIYFHVQPFNTGNANDSITWSFASSGAWTPTSVRMFWDINSSHSYDSQDILLTETSPGSKTYKSVTTGGTPVQLLSDDDYDIMMEVTVPGISSAPNNSSNVITVTAFSDFDNTKTSTGTYTTTVLAAALSAAKTHTPTGTSTYLKPGDLVTYTVTLTNSGGTAATGVTLNDPLPSTLTYVPGSLKISVNGAGFAAKTDAADNDGIKYDAGTRSIVATDGATTLDVAGGTTWAMQFQARLNVGVPSGSAVVNQATINYTSGISNVTIQTNGDTFLASTLAGIDLTSAATPKSGNPGDQLVYAFTAINNANAADTVDLTTNSTQGWNWKIWADANGDGIPGNAGDYLVTDTNGNAKLDTGALPQNGTIALLAVATMPVGSANGATETITISAASATDPTKTKALSFTSTVKAPVMGMTKMIIAVQAPGGGAICTPSDTSNGLPCKIYPGSTLTYVVTGTNSGNGNASSVVITDIMNQYMTYRPGTIRTGSSRDTLTARSDAADGDGAEYNSAAKAVVTPDGGGSLTLGPSGTWVVQYQLTVN
jgi:uncharacterized repeat protein (TIGR01451 family)